MKPTFVQPSHPLSASQDALLSGWGRTAPSRARLISPETTEAAVLALRNTARVIPRGLGRSYGDAAQLGGAAVLDLTRLDRILGFDSGTGVVEVEAGASLDHLMRVLVPRGWFVPVTPGTRVVTIGGAIASDVHGKNHHHAGSFANHVLEITLMTGDGEIRVVRPSVPASDRGFEATEGTSAGREPDDLFWATAGGMGLTGTILAAKIRMRPIRSSLIASTTERATDLEAVMSRLHEVDRFAPYTVAWLDCAARGRGFGRGLITHGDHADLEDDHRPDALAFPPDRTLSVPLEFPAWTLNRTTVAAFNTAWFHRASRKPRRELVTIPQFFHPLDGLGKWNRIYGRPGFIQYQFVVPDGQEAVIRRSITKITAAGGSSFLAVLKRFGPGNRGHLSFPAPGWTLALDIPASLPGLGRVLDRLDDHVVSAGGRIYLSKDSRMRPGLVEAMYPRLEEWESIRRMYDPDRKYTSDLARRLEI